MHLIPTIRFERTAKRTWSLLDQEGRSSGTLVRPKWYSSSAEIIAANGVYTVRSKKGWSSDLALCAEDVPIMIADYQWGGTVIKTTSGAELFRIVRKNWLSNRYSFVDPAGIMRLELSVGINWRAMERTYTFTEAGRRFG
ncbi:MAG: hypothetical protein ACO1NQ_07360 [Flavobacteriales bacterium]